jgi:formylglycine-generating enzyme required for sulfatase activity
MGAVVSSENVKTFAMRKIPVRIRQWAPIVCNGYATIKGAQRQRKRRYPLVAQQLEQAPYKGKVGCATHS